MAATMTLAALAAGCGSGSPGTVPENAKAPKVAGSAAPAPTVTVTVTPSAAAAGEAVPGGAAAPPPQASAQAPAVVPTPARLTITPCAGAPKLPVGIDERVCGPVPANAVKPRYHGGQYLSNTLASPSGNILCDMSQTTVMCTVVTYDFRPPPKKRGDLGVWIPNFFSVSTTATAGEWRGDPLVAELVANEPGAAGPQHIEEVGILPYGQVAAMGEVACVSQEAGMSCWNASTRHGFFVSRERYVIW